jgi:hypothetical protein
MTAKDGQGQADKAAAEKRTAQVAADNAAERAKTDAQAGDDVAQRVGTDNTPERTDGAPERLEGVDAAVAPYPLYEGEKIDALRSLAESRGVEINRDVEKALLIAQLRAKDRADVGAGPDADAVDVPDAKNPYPSYDVMPLEELRKLADSREVGLKPEDEKAHLVTELRAADSGVNTGGGTTV